MATPRLHNLKDQQSPLPDNLINSRFLSGLSREESLEVLARASRKQWAAGTWAFRQGEPANHLFMLESGRMKLYQTGVGGDVVVRFHVPGQVFGHGALVRKLAYPCSAFAVASSRTLSWTGDTVWQLMRSYPRLAENALGMLVSQLFQAQDRCLHLAAEKVETRLARDLAHLAFAIGRKSGHATLIGDGFSAKDLADLSGTTIFTVSRVLGGWERQGLLKKGRGWVMILDVDALLRASAKEDIDKDKPEPVASATPEGGPRNLPLH